LIELAEELRIAGKPPIALVVFDTLRASLAGSEDSSEIISAYIRAAERVARSWMAPGDLPPAVGIVHHAGWPQEGKGLRERGSSALRGNVDGTIVLYADKDPHPSGVGLLLATHKSRDEERARPIALVRRKVFLKDKVDPHGKPVSSCVVEGAEPAEVRNLRALLWAIAAHPALSSKEDIAKVLKLSKARTIETFVLGVQNGFIAEPKKQSPFKLTAKGELEIGIVPGSSENE
jgi:hypothetical protein